MSKSNKKTINELDVNIIQNGDDIANNLTNGQMSGQEYVASLNSQIQNGSPYQQRSAIRSAASFVQELSLMTLKQSVVKTGEGSYTDFFKEFEEIHLDEGNGIYFTANLDTGHTSYDYEKFIPDAVSTKIVEQYQIAMYERNGNTDVLTSNAWQFKKSITLQVQDWLPYFKSGALLEFVERLKNGLTKVARFYKFNRIANLIINAAPANTMTGTATNMFEAFTTEFLPKVREMLFLNTQFNYSNTSAVINENSVKNLRVIMSTKTLQILESGIRSQLFNNQNLNLGDLLTAENIRLLGNKIVIGNENTAITISDDPYVAENDIYVYSTDAVKLLSQIDTSESQNYTENLAVQLTYHVWGAADILPWGQMFKYTNPNLNVLPS